METKLVLMLILGLIMSSIIGCISDMYLMALAFIIVGFSTTVVGIGTQTIIQMEVEDLYRARVLTWWSSISFGSLTVGGILLGFAGEYIPLNIGMIIMPILGFIIFKLVVKLHFKNNFI
jgi:MFS family permease